MRQTTFFGGPRAAFALATVATITVGCNDVTPAVRPPALIAPNAVESRLVFSNADPRPGDDLVAMVQVRTGSKVGAVGSFTARVVYDPTRLELKGEAALGDEAMRVLNPVRGAARVAGISTKGFADGKLVALRFTTRGAGATSGMRVTFDELHALDREDLRRVVQAAHAVDPSLAR